MKLPRRRFLHLAAAATALPAFSSMVRAQAYPARPITMVVPYGAGGAIDSTGRILAEAMRGPIGQPVIVENVAGHRAPSASAASPAPHLTGTRSSLAIGPRTF
jgi:tripartite-type tricarboxylate transporter receptor subunit TctC